MSNTTIFWIVFCIFFMIAGSTERIRNMRTYEKEPIKKKYELNSHDLETLELLAIRAKNEERRRLRRLELLRSY